MKQLKRLSGILGLALLLGQGAAAAELRIGVVNTRSIIETAPQATQASDKIKQEFTPREAKLMDMQKALKLKQEKLARESVTMSESARRDMERELAGGQRELKTAVETFQEDLGLRRNEELKVIHALAMKAVNALAKDERFDLILGEENVLYVGEKVDITKKVLERMKDMKK